MKMGLQLNIGYTTMNIKVDDLKEDSDVWHLKSEVKYTRRVNVHLFVKVTFHVNFETFSTSIVLCTGHMFIGMEDYMVNANTDTLKIRYLWLSIHIHLIVTDLIFEIIWYTEQKHSRSGLGG